MTVNIGDTLFARNGKPAVVINKSSSKVDVSQNKATLKYATRHGYVNGLSPKDRLQFNEILDTSKSKEDPRDRIASLKEHIDKLREDPRNFLLTSYLTAELGHLINTYGIKQTEFSINIDQIK